MGNPQSFSKGSPLASIELENFRNLFSLQLNPNPKFNFFYGDNAQGKTSILEAIYFISELRSFRSQYLEALISHDKAKAFLRADLYLGGISQDIKISIHREDKSKEVYLNGKKPRPYSRLRQILPAVLFTPDSLKLFRSSPGERRNYFDRFISLLSEEYDKNLDDFEKVLKQKQSLLEIFRETGNYPKEQILVWDEKLASLSAELSLLRFRYTEKLNHILKEYFTKLSAGLWNLDLQYSPYCPGISPDQSLEKMRNIYESEIVKRREDERERLQVLVGIHRDDWNVWMSGQKLKEEGSQGQHRVCVAALKLSEVALLQEFGKTPLALFDDLLSELDYPRSRQILETLSECDCQVFLTSVTPLGIPLKGLEGLAYEVKNGQLFPNKLI